ncbi:hypothetical protein GQX74_003414 [Glossina fuscipes]|nr:hypothetical protein GQX74_003414 [Glossina fuscipes]
MLDNRENVASKYQGHQGYELANLDILEAQYFPKLSYSQLRLLLSLSYFYTISPCALRMLHSHLIMRALRSTIDGGSDGLYAWCCQQVMPQHLCHDIQYLHDYACDDDEREKIAYDVPKGPMSCNDGPLLHYSHNSCLHNQDYICLRPM